MSKHTSGPWESGRLQPHVDGRSRCEITEVGELGILAHVYVPDSAVSRRGNTEGNANVLVIAAAPELLNGCKALLGLIQLVRGRDDLPAALRDVLHNNHRIAEAEAALAKAQGSTGPGGSNG